MQAESSFLIVAHSGRALAASALRAGLSVHVLDLFSDQDTHQYARSASIMGDCQGGFDPVRLENAVARLFAMEDIAGLVIGSGFEDRPDLLGIIERSRRLLGNDPEVVRAAKDPALFFELLKRLGIPHPETLTKKPEDPSGWLIKRVGGAGGAHIRFLEIDGPCPDGHYFQRQVDGQPFSVIFLADGRHALMVGYSQLWQAPGFPETPFKYGGAMGWPGLDKCLQQQVEEAVQVLVAALGLQGLCGMDFIVDGDARWFVLEVNPRPPATFELHEHDRGLFSDHVLACVGWLPNERIPGASGISAHGILYAPWAITVPAGLAWPEWTSDRPWPGVRIGYGEPICMVHARDGDGEAIRRLVEERLAALKSGLGIFKEAA